MASWTSCQHVVLGRTCLVTTQSNLSSNEVNEVMLACHTLSALHSHLLAGFVRPFVTDTDTDLVTRVVAPNRSLVILKGATVLESTSDGSHKTLSRSGAGAVLALLQQCPGLQLWGWGGGLQGGEDQGVGTCWPGWHWGLPTALCRKRRCKWIHPDRCFQTNKTVFTAYTVYTDYNACHLYYLCTHYSIFTAFVIRSWKLKEALCS